MNAIVENCELWFYDIFEFWFRILKAKVLWKLKLMEYHVMNVV